MNFESREVSVLPGSALTSYVSLPGCQLIALGFRFFIQKRIFVFQRIHTFPLRFELCTPSPLKRHLWVFLFIPNHPAKNCFYFITVLTFVVQLLGCVQLLETHVCSSPCSSVHEISQARILEWVAISFSRRSSDQGSKLSLALQMDSLLLSHQGSPFTSKFLLKDCAILIAPSGSTKTQHKALQ